MRVAILGAGLLARSLMDVFVARDKTGEMGKDGYAVMLGHEDFDIRSSESLKRALDPHKPDVIVNTVALHALARCEDEPDLAFAVNAKGAGNVAALAPTVYVSTDYVFTDGGPHTEDMPGKQPRSVYGRSKFAGELETLERDGIVVRVAGLYGHHASRKGPTFPEQVTSSWEPMRVPTDQRFSPTYAPDAAERIADLITAWATPIRVVVPPTYAALSRLGGAPTALVAEGVEVISPGGIYHATNDGATSWYEFAEQIAHVAPQKRRIEGFEAKDALRPKDSSLTSTRLPPLRHWKIALAVWAEERQRRLYAARVSPLRPDALNDYPA